MAKDPFLLVSLEESESKSLAQVMSNDTARKILDYLSKHESATESKVAKDLGLALSTVHYNLQALVKATLVQAEEFHYSEKGKEVLHYSLANKLIIIAPKKAKTEGFMEKLKTLIPAAIISLCLAGIIQLYSIFANSASFGAQKLGDFALDAPEAARMAVQSVAEEASPMAAKMAAGAAANESADAGIALAQAAPQIYPAAASDFNLALVFLAGSLISILAVAIWSYYKDKKR